MRGGWVVLLMLGIWVGSANAYELKRDEFGTPVRWVDASVEWRVQAQGARSMEPADTLRVVKRAFAAWALHLQGLELVSKGLFEGTSLGYDRAPGAGNQNVVFFSRDDWPFESSAALAVTLTTFRLQGQGMVDADIVINERDYAWRTGGDAEGTYDLANTLTHEIGHFLGLAHSQDSEATMYARAAPSETSKRVLHADDVSGLVALYGADQVRLPELDSLASEVPVTRSGCAQIDLPLTPAGWLFALALLLALGGRRLLAIVAVGAAVSLFGPVRASASVLEGLTLEQLVTRSTVVFEGEVSAVEATWRDGLIVSEVTVEVSRLHKGTCGAQVVVRTFGGQVGDLRQVVDGAAHFDVGESVVLFGQGGAAAVRVVGLAQGKFSIVDGLGGGWAFRDPVGLHVVGPNQTIARAWHYVALDQLRAQLELLTLP